MTKPVSNPAFIKEVLANFLGVLFALALGLYTVLSIPVYIFRQLVIQYAKRYKPELGEVLNPQSAVLCNDYLNYKCPRANLVVSLYFKGYINTEEVKARVLEHWINDRDKLSGKLTFEKFSQYPVTWLGFAFWKNARDTFSVENHVHKLSGVETVMTDEMVSEVIEKLLNRKHGAKQSPWEIHVIENYQGVENGNETEKADSAIILNYHHSLADGMALSDALVALFIEDHSVKEKIAKPVYPRKSLSQTLIYFCTFPIVVFAEVSSLLSFGFKSSPWKVPDHKKEWYQVYAQSQPVSVPLIKRIKNKLGVKFSSVIYSAVSAGAYRILSDQGKDGGTMLTLSILPLPNRPKNVSLINHFTAVWPPLPTQKFKDPGERLKAVDKMLENVRGSIAPLLCSLMCSIFGAQFLCIGSLVAKNRMVSLGITNFPGIPIKTGFGGKTGIRCDTITGGLEGDCGVATTVFSHNDEIRIQACAEKAIMSRKELQQFVNYVTDEIRLLSEMIKD